MKLKKVSYKKVEKEVYPWKWGLEVVVTNNVNRYALMHEWYGYEDATAFHLLDAVNNKSIVVLPFEGSYGIIAHEAYHVLCAIYRTRGVKARDEEAIAYFLEDVTEDILRSIDDMKKKKTRYLTGTKRIKQ